MLINVVMQEKQRIEYMILKYNEMLEDLPKGSISERMIKGRKYYYLKYRSGKKVVSKYIAKEKVNDICSGIEKRKHIEAMIEALQEEYTLAQKVLEGNI